MSTVTLKANVTRILDADQPSVVLTPGNTAQISEGIRTAVLAFDALDNQYKYNAIEEVALKVRTSTAAQLTANALAASFDPSTICFDDYPDYSGTTFYGYSANAGVLTLDMGDYNGLRTVKNGVLLGSANGNLTFYTSAASASYRPSLTVTLGSSVHLEPTGYPTQGYVDKNADLELQWSNEIAGGTSLVDPTQTQAVIHWQMAGGAESTDTLNDASTSYTIPAGTLGSGAFFWWVEVTDDTGTTTSTQHYSLTTVEPLSTATALSPKNTTVDASSGVDFTWRHEISTGTAPSGADIELSDDGVTWNALAHVTGSAQTYHAAPGSVLSGTHFWRVKTYNQDTPPAAGSWSAAVTFAAIAPPQAPSVTATNEARPTVSWTAAEQQAYEIQIDSASYGPYFGQDASWLATTYLNNGSHTVKVRVQNAYGLWSAWGVWTFTVNNSTTPTITLTADAGENPDLAWTTSASPVPDAYLVYRDGELIAKTTALSWLDTGAAAGSHVYLIRGIYDADGTYAISNSLTVTATITGAVIMDALTGSVISCPTVLEYDRVIRETQSINVSFVHYAGAVWPVAEATKSRSNSYNFAPTWARGQEPDVLAWLGREVLVRDQYGGRVFGVLTRATPETRQTRVRISMQIQQTAEPEVVL